MSDVTATAAQLKLRGHAPLVTLTARHVTKQRPVRCGRRMIAEHRYTRDARVPFSADDPDMDSKWQSIPIRPTIDDGWEIFDSSKDRKTGWRHWHLVEGSG